MRISTAAFHQVSIEGMLNQQSALALTQNQLATGKKIQTPADDPIGAVHILELNRTLAESQQYGRNADIVESRLGVEEQALTDVGVLLRRVRELVLQANNGVADATSRNSIATELNSRAQELVDIANRRDNNAEFLFSGYATTRQPFTRVNSTVTYGGDQGVRQLQTGATQRVADGHSGFETFMNVQQGNGRFVTAVTGTNAGSGSIGTGTVTDRAVWTAAQPNTYTISFTAANTYQVTNSAAVVVGGGTYVSGNDITINGAQVVIEGAPAVGDTFTISPSQKEDMFTTIENIISAIQAADDTPASQGQFLTQMGGALQQLDQDEKHLLSVRADIGARMSMLDNAKSARENDTIELQRVLSSLQDLDYAEAISRMNQQLLGLTAAQKSYTQLSQLSLFNYL